MIAHSRISLKLPPWFKQEIPEQESLDRLKLISELGLHTVCREAHCPNLSYCFKNKQLTFLILGDTCTRNCRFCAVKKNIGATLAFDPQEPWRIAEMVKRLKIDYAVVTSVTRDDLADGGAGCFAKTIELIHALGTGVRVEVLIPDLEGRQESLRTILAAGPDAVAHNLETIKILYPQLRPMADYSRSLELLNMVKDFRPGVPTKSSLMLGLGEREEEVLEAMEDLSRHRCDYLTLGQYLPPSKEHYPVKEFISFEQFEKYRKAALGLGFKAVLSGPLVRSSYQAKQLYEYA